MPLHRLVFFVGGFDPRGPSRDHRECREAARLRPPSEAGERVSVGARTRAGPHQDHWVVDWTDASGHLWRTLHGVLRWDDLARRHWPRHWWQSWRDHLQVYGLAVWSGIFGRVWRTARGAFWLAMLPLGLALAMAALAAGASLGLRALTGWPVLAVLAAVLPLTALLWRRLELALDSAWLLRLYGFSWHQATGRLPDLEQRLDDWAQTLVAAARQTQARELLVVGHSSGSILAASALARACRQAPWLGSRGPAIALLTLGHCTPILGWLRPARAFRDDLALLADWPGLTWHDVSAPTDWAAFARVPPWLRRGGQARLAQMSPRFHATLGQGAYDALLARRHELHLQYLRAPRFSGGYDPVTWMAGPMTLAERHAALSDRPPARP